MQKTLIQGFVIAAAFVGIWFGFSQVDFMKRFRVEEAGNNTENKLGELLWETIQKTEDIITNDSIVTPVDKLVSHLAKANGIDRKDIKVHVIRKDEVNAFAMPDNHLVVYSGLIADCENESELAGVLGHEIAHLEKNHVMKKLIKEVGLSVLISMATGGKGGTAIKETLGLLSSSAYDRKLESEADMAAVDYLVKADLDPEAFANFMFKMSMNDPMPDEIYWIATHPESEARAKAIIAAIKGKKFDKKRCLSVGEWESLKDRVEN